jgi:hypothetical protein
MATQQRDQKTARRAPFLAPPPPRFASAPPKEASGERARRKDVDDAAFAAAAADVRAKWGTRPPPNGALPDLETEPHPAGAR